MARRVLFLCSGNYYRSRFAEHLFNFLAAQAEIGWQGVSRGLAVEFSPHNVGPLSKFAASALASRGIALAEPMRMPLHVLEQDLADADLVIALKEAEHRPLVEQRFAAWANRIEYWHVHDLDGAPAETALPEIEQHVQRLIDRLKSP